DSFFTVSGVTATRVSPATVSAGTPISIEISSEQGGHTECGQSLQQDYRRPMSRKFPSCFLLEGLCLLA
ncbi:hypothetical protein, partial [Variovorax sp. 67-131]